MMLQLISVMRRTLCENGNHHVSACVAMGVHAMMADGALRHTIASLTEYIWAPGMLRGELCNVWGRSFDMSTPGMWRADAGGHVAVGPRMDDGWL